MKVSQFRPFMASLAVAALAVLVASCGTTEGGGLGGRHPDYDRMLAGSPPPLAALHSQGNVLLPGGIEAYEARIAQLHGHPVVVNLWASWCGPCRLEFPLFQQVAAREGKRVAFLGINMEDSDSHARAFLEEAPVPYPSYTDSDASIAESVSTRRGLPQTAFYDRNGTLTFVKVGPYENAAELERDIQLHAVEGEGSG